MKTVKAFVEKNYYYLCFAGILCLALFTRTYQVGSIPQSLYVDEAGVGCNAWCLAHYGVDRYLNEMPIYPQNYRDGQSPLYTYLLALLIKTAGKGELSVALCRIPAILFSLLTVIMGTMLVRLVFKNKKIALMGAFFLTVCPFFFMNGRYALDCNLMLGCCMTSMYFLVRYVSCPKIRRLLPCGIAFGITLYSYAMSYVIIALFCILASLYLLYTRKIPLIHIIIWAACIVITALPVILFIFSLLFGLPPYKFLCFTIAPIARHRVGEAFTESFWESMRAALSISLTHGDMPVDSIKKYYTMYVVSIPFILLGFGASLCRLAVSLRSRVFRYEALFVLFFLSALTTVSIFGINHSAYRGNSFFVAYLYFLVYGITILYSFVKNYQKLFICVLASCYLIWSASFMRFYFREYEVSPYPNSLYAIPASAEIQYALDNLEMERLYLDCITIGENYLFFHPESPFEVNGSRHDEGFGKNYFLVNEDTPIEENYVYIVRKENFSFWQRLSSSGLGYTLKEFPYYCVVSFP